MAIYVSTFDKIYFTLPYVCLPFDLPFGIFIFFLQYLVIELGQYNETCYVGERKIVLKPFNWENRGINDM
jgi:hypothetical protein